MAASTVSLCLASNFPIDIVWGPKHTQIYNDGYRAICGDKHPAALGMDFTECWASAWPVIGQPFKRALEGVASFLENQRIFLFRKGYLEETFFTFSFSPIRDETGEIGGLFHPVTETTATMIGERRTRALRDLTGGLGEAKSAAEVFRTMIETLAGFDLDLPFVLLYKLDEEQQSYRLAGATGVGQGTFISPEILALNEPSIWPMEHLLHREGVAPVAGLRALMQGTACGPYDEAPDLAFAAAIRQPGTDAPVALLMAGVSPRLPMNDVYEGFYDLIVAAFGAALARVTAAEDERKRLELLAEIDRAKTVFFSNVSHEFRTPLTLMLGPLEEALQTEGLPEVQRERLQMAGRNAQRLLKLVNSLLDFSRIEAGRNDAHFVPTDLSALTRDLASNFRSACLQAGLSLSVGCAALSRPVYVDPEMWEKIVLNLLSNALKFTLHGRIDVSLRDLDGGVVLEVADTGVGIPAAELPLVFDRFHRAEGQRGRSVEGTGIGLSLVRELVQLHGGRISATSVHERGSTFRISLPFGKGHLPAERVQLRPGAPVEPKRAQTYVEEALRWLPDAASDRAGKTQGDVPMQAEAADKPRVLLADDNADKRAYIQRILEEDGYSVEAVPDGAAALQAARAGALPDLVLSDVMMPKLDGFALLEALRADEATKSVVVILLSARAGEEARLEGLAAGADDYMVKPFSARELLARVDGAITLARQRRASAAREQELLTEIETERSRAQLSESQAHVASLFEQTAAGLAETDSAGRVLRVNERYCRIVGRSRYELIGRQLGAFIHPAGLQENLVRLGNTLGSVEPFEIDNRYQHPDGSTVWASETVNPIRIDGADQVVGALAVVLDITGRKKAEAKLKETADRLQFTLEAAQIGDWDLDLINNVAYRSARHDRCFGYKEPIADWNFDKFLDHVHADDREHVAAQFHTALTQLEKWQFECRVIWPDQSVHWIAAHGGIYQPGVRPTRMTGIVMDITERKQAEEEIAEASRRKDEFLAMLAHELRNPLAPISATAELLGRARVDDERLAKTSAIITRQVRHITGLVDDLLDVSRVTRGLVTVNKGLHEVKSLISSAVEQVQPILQARRHRLVIDLAPEAGYVLADEKRLVQILTNLLNNAAKFTPRAAISSFARSFAPITSH